MLSSLVFSSSLFCPSVPSSVPLPGCPLWSTIRQPAEASKGAQLLHPSPSIPHHPLSKPLPRFPGCCFAGLGNSAAASLLFSALSPSSDALIARMLPCAALLAACRPYRAANPTAFCPLPSPSCCSRPSG
ncbi:hypothetical protein BO71DRAFT_153344 [Aspergillus ellipticus CBS 707.79]|uniref:Uncharacterized protein n=1 Tax=Aspergillus ellipticus CBS 707.79 TaxID=1448320 RepID=A0A319DA93_9EURO|nr:hypothetical protein BO71DRAFT_153344 [Aspergillus ellipticus CBS 707.79]